MKQPSKSWNTAHPKKSGGVLRSSVRLKYAFIARHQQVCSVLQMCRMLRLPPSGHYAWKAKPESKRAVDALYMDVWRRRPCDTVVVHSEQRTSEPERLRINTIHLMPGLNISKLCRWFGMPRRTVYYHPIEIAGSTDGTDQGHD